MTDITSSIELRVWVGCLACYNAGSLTGKWLPALEADDFKCPNATHDEFLVFDSMGFTKPLGEISPIAAKKLATDQEELADWCDKNDYPLAAFLAYLSNENLSVSSWWESSTSFEDSFCGGSYLTFDEYADDFGHELGYCLHEKNKTSCYFDSAAFANDLLCDGYWTSETEKDLFIFRPI